LTVFFGGVILAIVWDPFVGAFLSRGRNRGEVRALYDAIHPGMNRAEAERETTSGRYPHLTFFNDTDQGWVVTTPYEFGATNWMLLIDVEEDRVTKMRIRTDDGIDDHPVQAPPDKLVSATGREGAEVPPNDGLQERTRPAQASEPHR
jgi:hypothetical protein